MCRRQPPWQTVKPVADAHRLRGTLRHGAGQFDGAGSTEPAGQGARLAQPRMPQPFVEAQRRAGHRLNSSSLSLAKGWSGATGRGGGTGLRAAPLRRDRRGSGAKRSTPSSCAAPR